MGIAVYKPRKDKEKGRSLSALFLKKFVPASLDLDSIHKKHHNMSFMAGKNDFVCFLAMNAMHFKGLFKVLEFEKSKRRTVIN